MRYIQYFIIINSFIWGISLQEVFDNATEYGEYEKYIILEPNTIYTGGIGIFEGDIYINCQGSIIDLEEGNGIWVYADVEYPSSLDIEYCTITNGLYYGLSFGGMASGNINNCNFIDTNFGLKLFDVSDVYLTNSIFANHNTYGIGLYGDDAILETSYSLFWENEESDCMENCPGWGSIWTQLELTPGTGIIYENPIFLDSDHLNFELSDSSPCIDSGNPNLLDIDGSISDIGANPYNDQYCMLSGDLNEDGLINVIDIIDLTNCILFNNNCTICFDMNNDNEYNILDILDIVNLIIN